MQHLDEGTIHSWLDGALAPDEAARVESHVRDCAECASAVAEARGFIAASSRILTKLDDVPAGVVPVARPVRRRNAAAWRAAAAVLVVAVGSLVVMKNRGSDRSEATSQRAAATEVVLSAPVSVDRGTTDSVQPQAAATMQKAPQSPAKAAPRPASTSSRDEQRRDRPTAQDMAEAPQANAAVAPFAADAMAEAPPLRVVREEHVPGGKRTLYAVAPTDTVILFESTGAELRDAAVATGAAAPSARRAVSAPAVVSELSAKAPAVVVDTQAVVGRASGGAAAQAMSAKSATPPPAAAAPTQPKPVRTITWMDVTSGRQLTLSGRVPVDQLEEIKRRIERERAAAARKSSR